jgi:putative adenylate-forming enzyme
MNTRIMWKLMGELSRLRRHENWSRHQLVATQADRLHRLREFAYARSPFYQRFHKGLTDHPLGELPVLTKAQLMESFDELVTDRAVRLEDLRAHLAGDNDGRRYLNRYWVNATSGSSGEPGIFLFDEKEWVMVLASFARAHEWAGVRVSLTHRMKMASIASVSPWHMSAQVGATLKSRWMPALRMAASEPVPQLVSRLNAWQPEMLVAYASMARILAEEQLAERLQIHPHLVFTSSEVLTDATRRRAQAAWGHPPFNQYGATEVGDLAAEHDICRRMHLFEDLIFVEIVDDENRPVTPGEFGAKLLVTSLFGRTLPLVRYELNDRVRLAPEPSPCRLPFAVLDGIQGRTEDMLQLAAVGGGTIGIQPLVVHRIMDILPISGWQVVRSAPDELTVLLSGLRDGLAEMTIAERLRGALAAAGAVAPRVAILRVEAIPQGGSGKTTLIQNYQPPGPISTQAEGSQR